MKSSLRKAFLYALAKSVLLSGFRKVPMLRKSVLNVARYDTYVEVGFSSRRSFLE